MNRIKMLIGYSLKVVAALALSGVILSIFSFFYYNPPVHIGCEDGATGYKREPGAFWSRGTEGFAIGTIDDNGYNNSYDTDYSDIDILLMGSSQTEALYVSEDKCISYLLNESFDKSGDDMTVYNIGMSSHNFISNVANLKLALEKYKPSEYVILENLKFDFTDEKIDSALSGQNVVFESYNKDDLLYKIQKIPFVKLCYLQYKNYKNNIAGGNKTASDKPVYSESEKVNELLKYINQTASDYDCRAVIFYIPDIEIEYDGSLTVCESLEQRNEFAKLCSDNNIIYVDMTEVFLENYEENYTLPNGYANTKANYGHINEDGHRMIADKLYTTIIENN